MWEKLKQQFDGSSNATTRLNIIREFTTSRQKPDEKINDYLNRINILRQQLQNTEDHVSDRRFKIHLYTTLSLQFATVVSMLSRSDPPLDEVISSIRQDELNRQYSMIGDENISGTTHTAMAASNSTSR